MSQNMEVVRSAYAGWERGDYSSAEWAHPEIQYVFADGPTPGGWTGLACMAEGVRQMRSKGASVFNVRGGKVTRLVAYLNRERAFADLGLSE